MKDVHAAIADGVTELQQQPTQSPELWAKLARGALSRNSLSQSLQCARAALQNVPGYRTFSGSAGNAAAAGGGIGTGPEAFWASVAELLLARGTLALLQPQAQDVGVQLGLRQTALTVCSNASPYLLNTVLSSASFLVDILVRSSRKFIIFII